jgi:hypothetical protein
VASYIHNALGAGIAFFQLGIGNVKLGERNATFFRAFECDERAAVDYVTAFTYDRTPGAAVEIDVGRTAATLNELPACCARNVDILAKSVMLVFGPSTNFIERQTISL